MCNHKAFVCQPQQFIKVEIYFNFLKFFTCVETGGGGLELEIEIEIETYKMMLELITQGTCIVGKYLSYP